VEECCLKRDVSGPGGLLNSSRQMSKIALCSAPCLVENGVC
jgi:hypothetical protein